jgi:SecD/SecF fusion protein
VLSLLVYALYLWAVVKIIPVALTLPGMAGLILTIGVAADASVVIFERVREEARAGRPARVALLNGYKRGITAIVDANIVTLVTAIFIFLIGTAGPKGFAFMLILGVILSLFTAIVLTQGLFGLLVETKLFQNERLMGFNAREIKWKMDIVGKWKMWMAIAFVPLIAGAVVIGVRGIEQGIDFTGGTRLTVAFTQQQPNDAQVRDVVAAFGQPTAIVTRFESQDEPRTRGYEITTKELSTAQQTALLDRLAQTFGPRDESVQRVETVGASFGQDIVRKALWAIFFSFLAIIAYLAFRFEWKLALAALVSVVHDVWLTLSVYSIAGKEVTAATVAALLTILGYSLYDVVIVFDRIRENMPLMRGRPYREIVNRSVHETLTRSIITFLLTVLPIIALLIFGGPSLFDFSFALAVGILAGGVSSIFISAPLAAIWKEREPDQQKVAARLAKKAARAATVDSDILDVDALTRAEASLDANVPLDGSADLGGLPEPAAEEPVTRTASTVADPEPEAKDAPADAPETDGPESTDSSDDSDEQRKPTRPATRPRRHQNVRRRRR